ncbi:metallophosphoesterase [Fodinicola feengrottensis]|uniref:Metallophosphoesterase n=1 Tax=Fodinicola feengrottensis TaxID=435914 RepID=A0ABN2IKY1_9ACTN
MIVIAHLSDVHIDGDARSVERTRAVMTYLENLAYDLDVVLVTGDIADHGLPSEYEQARKLLTSRHPVLICPGNHDERAAFREHLLGQPGSAEPVNQVFEAAGFAVVLCDSSVPGKDDGYLQDETLEWLDGVLAGIPDDRPVLVGFHHPPVPLNTPYVDGIRQYGEQRLADLASRHRNIVAFLCGHAHTPAVTTFASRPLLVAPGVVSTLKFPWESQEGPDDHVDLRLPPSLAFHILDDEGRLTTHYRTVLA